jgi:alanyl-tRNA synthetase
MKSAELRKTFLSYFQERGHTVVPSASLVPAGDPTLLFVNAGMVPFKDVFLGKEKRSYKRATSCQKCLRVSGKHNDLEEVGPSSHHHTFFEMLGNFSFGDYFKEEALAYSWEFLTKTLGLPPEKLHPTVYEEDEESAQIWSKLKSIPVGKVVRLGPEDNFWAMGDTGPCGPNSEIIYDRTGRCLRDGSDCPLTCDCDRWWELWNNVFMQFDRAPDGTLTPLAQVGVDTGMGFERLCAVLQGAASSYETDLFVPIFEELAHLTHIDYANASNEQQTAMRILADHTRAGVFLIADGVRPSNEGRGYVLRRLLRRAIYYARTRLVSRERYYLDTLARAVGGSMSEAYPELHKEAPNIVAVLQQEEDSFNETLSRGRRIVAALARYANALKTFLETAAHDRNERFSWASSRDTLAAVWQSTDLPEVVKVPFLRPYNQLLGDEPWMATEESLLAAASITPTLNGETAFFLSDTYGIPPELTGEVALDNGLAVDLAGFERFLEQQRERGRGAREEGKEREDALLAATRDFPATKFVGYDGLKANAAVLLLESDGLMRSASESDGEINVVLDISPFYAEGGGQVGDSGRIVGPKGEAEITSVRRLGGVFVHRGRVVRGQIKQGEAVRAEVDETSRRATMRNHTATHLLHRALRVVLGPQAKQAGSLVAPDHLRFDFLHGKPLTDDELREVERLVREQILLDRPVRTDVLPVQQALASGADAMFDEKYGEEARVVSVGNGETLRPGSGQAFSRELCGGTHCRATGEIGAFFIVEQRSVGAGVRRVEAVTGFGAFEYVDARRRLVDQLSREYHAPLPELPERLRALQERAREQPKAAALPDPAEVLARAEQRDGTLIIIDRIDGADSNALREFGDELRKRAKSAAIVLASVADDQPSIIVMLTADRVKAGLHAGKLAQQLGKEMGAGGGGRADVATAGGKDASRLDAALAKARELLGVGG